MPYYTRDGYQLYYYHNGQDKWPIIFIHGYLGSSNSHWGDQLNNSKLSSHFQVIAPDLRGYAKSSVGKKVEKHQTLDHILDLRFLVTHLKLQKKPVFVGYSIGGTLALMYAVKYPQSVQGILLVSPRPFLHKATRSWNFMAKEKRSGESKSTMISLTWTFVKRIQKLMSFIAIKRQMKRSQEYLQELGQIDAPILMLYGTKDTVNPSIGYD
ncbi:MAG: alpha/beta hydrolase, partial [Candidatus Heimdallarchaeota archaeon]